MNFFIKVSPKKLKENTKLIPCLFSKGKKTIYFNNFSDENSYSIYGGKFFKDKMSRYYFLKINKKTKLKSKEKIITLSSGWYWLRDAIYVRD